MRSWQSYAKCIERMSELNSEVVFGGLAHIQIARNFRNRNRASGCWWTTGRQRKLSKCALARHLSIQTTLLRAECYYRSTPVDQKACPACSSLLTPNACRSRCISCLIRCALARAPSIQMPYVPSSPIRFLCLPCLHALHCEPSQPSQLN